MTTVRPQLTSRDVAGGLQRLGSTLDSGVHGKAGSGRGLLTRPASERKELKVYFFLPHARPVRVKKRSRTNWFGQAKNGALPRAGLLRS